MPSSNAAMEKEWKVSFEKAVEKTRQILNAEQRKKYEEMMKIARRKRRCAGTEQGRRVDDRGATFNPARKNKWHCAELGKERQMRVFGILLALVVGCGLMVLHRLYMAKQQQPGSTWQVRSGEELQRALMTGIKEQLGATDDEWKVMQPKIEKVMTARRTGGRGVRRPAARWQ